MRPFPASLARIRSIPTVVGVAVLSLVLLFGSTAFAQVKTADSLQDLYNDVQESGQALKDATAKYLDAQSKLDTATQQLDQVQAELAAAQTELDAIRVRLDAAQKQLEVAKADLVAGQQAVDEEKAKVREALLQTFTSADPALQQITQLLSAEDPSDIVRQQQFQKVLSTAQARTYADLQAAEILLDVHATEAKRIEEQIAADEALQAQKVAEVADRKAEAQRLKDSMVGLVAATEEAKKTAQDEYDKAQAAYAAERAKAPTGSNDTIYTGGTFLRPVVGGYISSEFGYRFDPVYQRYQLHAGTDVAVSCGTVVHAVAPGLVVTTQYGGIGYGYGNRIVIDHGILNGQHIYTTYNHLSAIQVSVGQLVLAGDQIALSGGKAGAPGSGASTGCHLHFEVALGSPAGVVNPRGYVNF